MQMIGENPETKSAVTLLLCLLMTEKLITVFLFILSCCLGLGSHFDKEASVLGLGCQLGRCWLVGAFLLVLPFFIILLSFTQVLTY